MRKNIVITGLPRSGKSTLLKSIVHRYSQKVGFVANEIRVNDQRVGFEIETHTGKKSVIAHIDFDTDLKVSRYGVKPDNLDVIIPDVESFEDSDLLYIDEIGQMKLFSEKFKQLVLRYLDAKNTCVVTLSKVYTDAFTEQIKLRNDIIFVEINEESRSTQQQYVAALLQKIDKAKRYLNEPSRFSYKDDEYFLQSDHDVRQLTSSGNGWTCRCPFFQDHSICSHVIALEEYILSSTNNHLKIKAHNSV